MLERPQSISLMLYESAYMSLEFLEVKPTSLDLGTAGTKEVLARSGRCFRSQGALIESLMTLSTSFHSHETRVNCPHADSKEQVCFIHKIHHEIRQLMTLPTKSKRLSA